MKLANKKYHIFFDLNGVLIIKNTASMLQQNQRTADAIQLPKYRPVNLAANLHLLKACKNAGHILYVLSNMTIENYRLLRKNPQIESLLSFFDHIIISDHLPFPKPAPEAYTAAFDQYDVPVERSIVIDDKEENLHGAQQSGITKTILCEDFDLEQVKQQLETFGAIKQTIISENKGMSTEY